jgi:hemoglobin/transferrin/lactoferrin receptor protein
MIRCLMVVLLFGGSWSLKAQTLRLYDATNAQPLEKVTVRDLNSGLQTKSDAKGIASLHNFTKEGTLELTSEGYKTRQWVWLGQDTSLYLYPKYFELEEIVVSAPRVWELRQAPSVEMVKVSDWQKSAVQPQTSADLLSATGRVFVQKSQQGGGSPMIRGFAANRLVYTIDGVRMNTAIFRGGNLQQVLSLDPNAMESTEVVMGPGSVVHGSDAIGGAMNFVSHKPKLGSLDSTLHFGQVISRVSSASKEETHHVHWGQGGEKWAVYSGISYSNFGHLRQGRRGPSDYLKPYYPGWGPEGDRLVMQEDSLLQVPGAFSQIHLSQKLRFQPNQNWDMGYGFYFSQTSAFGRYDRHQQEIQGVPRHALWNYGPQTWSMHLLSLEHNGMTKFYDQWNARIALQHFGESRIERRWLQPLERHREEAVEALSVNVDALKKLGTRIAWKYGWEAVSNRVQSSAFEQNIFTGDRGSLSPRYPKAWWASLGLYTLQEIRMLSNLDLFWGLRYNEVLSRAEFGQQFPLLNTQKIRNGALTGHLGLAWKPSEKWNWRANLGSAFRSPNIDDLGKLFEVQEGVVVVPNPSLRPEYAWSFDLATGCKISESLTLEGSIFGTYLQDAMVRRTFLWEGRDSIMFEGLYSQVQALQNGAFSGVIGGHLGLEWHWTFFRALADFNFQKGIEETVSGEISPIRHAPPSFGRLFFSYTQGAWEWNLWSMFQLQRNHEQMPFEERLKVEIYALDSMGRAFSPAWCSFHASLRYTLGDWGIHLGLDNIFDKRYRPYASGVSAPGRDLRFSIQYSW